MVSEIEEIQEGSPCRLCVKLSVDLRCAGKPCLLSDAPNTFDVVSQKYEWKNFDLMNYALIPRALLANGVQVAMYICMDEEDLDDMDLNKYVESFLKESLLPLWQGFSVEHISEPTDEPPFEIGCPRSK